MAQLKNTPQQQLTFDLERRKSYTFRCVLMNSDRSPVDLTGSTIRLVVKKPEFDFDNNDTTNMIINSVAAIDAPLAGEAVFSLQAAELDFAPGAYNYSIVLWTPEGYSAVMVKGVLNLHANTDSLSMSKRYFSGTAGAALELTMRGEQVVNIVANTLTRADSFRNIVGTGRPDNNGTLEASTLQLVNSAPTGALFISLDGAGVGAWAWRKRLDGWKIVEGTPTYWPDIQNKPTSYPPSAHSHPVEQISATGNRLASNVFLGGDGTWKTPAVAWTSISGKPSSYPPDAHSHTAAQISDASSVGRSVLTATNSSFARTALEISTSSTSKAGLVELATTTETTLGTDSSRAVTPLGLRLVVDTKAAAAHEHTAADIDSGAAPDGHVLTADGAGGVVWEAPPAGTGSGIRNVSGTVTLDATPGIYEVYALAAATVNGVALAPGDAAVFRYLSGSWSWMIVGQHTTWQAPEPTEPTAVTATAPTFTDADGTANDRYVIPAKTGVEYRKGGAAIAAGTYTPTAGESVTITAVALDGYTLTGTTSWSKVFSTSTAPISVTATAPTWTDDPFGGGGSWSTPAIVGVAYSPASGTATPGQSVTVTATAQPGYSLTGTSSWTHTFPVAEVAAPEIITEDFAGDGALAGKVTTTGGLTWTQDTQATNYSGAWANAVATRSSGALVSATPANPAAGYVAPATAPVKAEATFSLPSTDGQLWLSIRAGAAATAGNGDNIYVTYIRSQNAFKMYHGDGGPLAQVGSNYSSSATTGTVAIELIGTAAKVYLNGAVIISGTTTKTPTGTKAAIGVKGTGASVDNLKVWLS